jgi:hypothetical protein
LSLSKSDIDALVLATVNAPCARKLDGVALAAAIRDGVLARLHAGPLSTFFYELSPALQRQFASGHGISDQALATAATTFSEWSGVTWPGAIVT